MGDDGFFLILGLDCLKVGVLYMTVIDIRLYENINEGKMKMETIDNAVRNILRIKFLLSSKSRLLIPLGSGS
jgi:hypothetical protein